MAAAVDMIERDYRTFWPFNWISGLHGESMAGPAVTCHRIIEEALREET
jgi:hypothetical protein